MSLRSFASFELGVVAERSCASPQSPRWPWPILSASPSIYYVYCSFLLPKCNCVNGDQ